MKTHHLDLWQLSSWERRQSSNEFAPKIDSSSRIPFPKNPPVKYGAHKMNVRASKRIQGNYKQESETQYGEEMQYPVAMCLLISAISSLQAKRWKYQTLLHAWVSSSLDRVCGLSPLRCCLKSTPNPSGFPEQDAVDQRLVSLPGKRSATKQKDAPRNLRRPTHSSLVAASFLFKHSTPAQPIEMKNTVRWGSCLEFKESHEQLPRDISSQDLQCWRRRIRGSEIEMGRRFVRSAGQSCLTIHQLEGPRTRFVLPHTNIWQKGNVPKGNVVRASHKQRTGICSCCWVLRLKRFKENPSKPDWRMPSVSRGSLLLWSTSNRTCVKQISSVHSYIPTHRHSQAWATQKTRPERRNLLTAQTARVTTLNPSRLACVPRLLGVSCSNGLKEGEGADTLNPDLDGESRDWMGESQSQQCGVGLLDYCKAFSMDGTHSAATLCCDAPSSRTNRIRSHWATRFLCHPLRLDGHWMAGISRAADDSC